MPKSQLKYFLQETENFQWNFLFHAMIQNHLYIKCQK
jgi:hypothetical protein